MEELCSQLSTYFERHVGLFRSKGVRKGILSMLRTAGETETTQENIQNWLELNEAGLAFRLLVLLYFLNKGSTVIFLIYLYQHDP
jgi:hypothetical protein